ncbi:uncharacterized protein TRIADDRAFT_63700 [Trichoplax adhaerens]|uniref:Nuclear protein localization protein 4 homolog n=1 Tax=Trichoplax adhaerens TaxID=10228 RepID=B3RMF9_TRIAD|nr:hypothetical protein TRIADDRAFT_63700 [Trichoplax adhaerens]EDV28357.1 hypothetical protein TRIADDRAFT_63700 [Trichoplax adhaerens]|eukprot:XP_002110191.1 hypothetical protein TRIADDRAFT_63700 [Trichoplax adhaerens]
MAQNSIIVRIQSKEGTKRIQIPPTSSVGHFLNEVRNSLNLSTVGWSLYKDRQKNHRIANSRKTLTSIGIKHGDLLLLHEEPAACSSMDPDECMDTTDSAAAAVNNTTTLFGNSEVLQDEVDILLSKEDGLIHRKRHPQLCRHGPMGKCIHCSPLEPFDEEYLSKLEPPIKHLSFHSYIRKLRSGVDKGKFTMLENVVCTITPGCKEHPPWPNGICTKCQPNAITLNRQSYRHIDYVMFQNSKIMENFLNYWRSCGCQRLGYLYGYYDPHKDVPLGIKTVVVAIYEPPQKNTKNSIQLLEDAQADTVDAVAKILGLRKVGWIVTDLLPKDVHKGTVQHTRGVDMHLMSAEECIMAAAFQNAHPNPCKYARDKYFGSKFVTVIVSGDCNDSIDIHGYQVSNQCMSLVRDNCLVPTRDDPTLAYVRNSTNIQYVPDVFYKMKDEYNNEKLALGRPLPVEYLLIDVPNGFPKNMKFLLDKLDDQFPIENRDNIGQPQNFNVLAKYAEQHMDGKFLEMASDFHFLTYLVKTEIIKLEDLQPLATAVKQESALEAIHFKRSKAWQTVEQLMKANGPPQDNLPKAATSWSCQHCTFINARNDEACEMCNLPRS